MLQDAFSAAQQRPRVTHKAVKQGPLQCSSWQGEQQGGPFTQRASLVPTHIKTHIHAFADIITLYISGKWLSTIHSN